VKVQLEPFIIGLDLGTTGWKAVAVSACEALSELCDHLEAEPLVFGLSEAMHSLLAVDARGDALASALTWAVARLLVSNLYADVPRAQRFERIDADSGMPALDGLVVLPYLTGERSPHWRSDVCFSTIPVCTSSTPRSRASRFVCLTLLRSSALIARGP
jgi:sugar (pentulose or hexulose) kinase